MNYFYNYRCETYIKPFGVLTKVPRDRLLITFHHVSHNISDKLIDDKMDLIINKAR